jgi:Tfp pilus assembly protein PilV
MKLFAKTRTVGNWAFSLVEVVISMALVSVLFVSLYTGIGSGFGFVSHARESFRANQILAEKMETLRLYSWDQINSNGFVPATFTAQFVPTVHTNFIDRNGRVTRRVVPFKSSGVTYHGTVSITNAPVPGAYSTNMRQVTVTLNWTNGPTARTRELRTFIARNGIQNYAYY